MRYFLLAIALLTSSSLFATPYGGLPSEMVARNAASSTIGLLYSSANAEVFSNMKAKSNFSIYNGSGSSLGVGVRSNSCASTTLDNYMIPAATGLVIEDVAMAKALCIRSLSGSSITSGTVFLSVW